MDCSCENWVGALDSEIAVGSVSVSLCWRIPDEATVA